MKKVFIYGDPAILQNYKNALSACRTQCVISQNVNHAKQCNALLLAGGGDVSPCLYSAVNTNSLAISLKRDISELYLIAYFFHRNAPIMGVCRGLQIINVFFEGTLNQKIPHEELHYAKNKDVTHRITTSKSGFMRELFGEKAVVNSAHRQSVAKLGKDLFVCAKASDNTIEALRHRSKKIIAVQFHPERMNNKSTQNGQIIYDYFTSMI